MKTFFSLFIGLFVVALVPTAAQTLFPSPQHYQRGKGTFILSRATSLTDDSNPNSRFIERLVPFMQSEQGVSNHIRCNLTSLSLTATPEGYTLNVTPDSILLQSATPAGLSHAREALVQLARFGQGSIPCLHHSGYAPLRLARIYAGRKPSLLRQAKSKTIP